MLTHNNLRTAKTENDMNFKKWLKGFLIDILIGFLLGAVIMLIIGFSGCSEDGTNVIVTDPNPGPPIVDPPLPDPDNELVQIALYTGTSIMFYDGDVIWTWKTGNITRTDSGIYTHENLIYELNEYGQTLDSKYLVAIPDYSQIDDDGNIWLSKTVPPEEAFGLGALYKDYTKIYKNADEYENWFEREYKTSDLISLNNDLFTKSDTDKYYHIDGDKTDIRIAFNKGFACYNYDSGLHMATIDGIEIDWITNYMNNANYWIESGGVWYSQNGYTWNGSVLNENGSIMTEWRTAPYLTGYTEAPVLISAGNRYENSEYVLYWIECNSGWIIKYIPSINQMSLFVRLYTGDGLRTTGLLYQNLLKPIIAENNLYFIFDANVYRYNFESGLTGHFTSGISEVWGY